MDSSDLFNEAWLANGPKCNFETYMSIYNAMYMRFQNTRSCGKDGGDLQVVFDMVTNAAQRFLVLSWKWVVAGDVQRVVESWRGKVKWTMSLCSRYIKSTIC